MDEGFYVPTPPDFVLRLGPDVKRHVPGEHVGPNHHPALTFRNEDNRPAKDAIVWRKLDTSCNC